MPFFFLAKVGLSNNIAKPCYLHYISWPLKMLQQGINQAHPFQSQQGLDRKKDVTALCVQSC